MTTITKDLIFLYKFNNKTNVWTSNMQITFGFLTNHFQSMQCKNDFFGIAFVVLVKYMIVNEDPMWTYSDLVCSHLAIVKTHIVRQKTQKWFNYGSFHIECFKSGLAK